MTDHLHISLLFILIGVIQIVKQPDRVFLRDFSREKPESFMKEKDSLTTIVKT